MYQWDIVGAVLGEFLLRRGFCSENKADGDGGGEWVLSDSTNIFVVIMMVVVVVMLWGWILIASDNGQMYYSIFVTVKNLQGEIFTYAHRFEGFSPWKPD